MRLRAAEQPPDDSRLAKLAADQHGVVARRQLVALGFSSQAIKTLVSRERLHRLHLGVYAVGQPRLRAQGRWMAAVRALVRDHHLPMPQFNVYVEGELVDVVWPEHRLIVEVDGYKYHRGKRTFGNDRRRDRALVRAHWTVVRFTDDQVDQDPAGVAAELSELLFDGPWPPPAR